MRKREEYRYLVLAGPTLLAGAMTLRSALAAFRGQFNLGRDVVLVRRNWPEADSADPARLIAWWRHRQRSIMFAVHDDLSVRTDPADPGVFHVNYAGEAEAWRCLTAQDRSSPHPLRRGEWQGAIYYSRLAEVPGEIGDGPPWPVPAPPAATDPLTQAAVKAEVWEPFRVETDPGDPLRVNATVRTAAGIPQTVGPVLLEDGYVPCRIVKLDLAAGVADIEVDRHADTPLAFAVAACALRGLGHLARKETPAPPRYRLRVFPGERQLGMRQPVVLCTPLPGPAFFDVPAVILVSDAEGRSDDARVIAALVEAEPLTGLAHVHVPTAGDWWVPLFLLEQDRGEPAYIEQNTAEIHAAYDLARGLLAQVHSVGDVIPGWTEDRHGPQPVKELVAHLRRVVDRYAGLVFQPCDPLAPPC
jgi:hypothetical protein